MRWVRLTKFLIVLEPTTRRMKLILLTMWQGPRKIPACTWGRVLRNNLKLLVAKILSMFIRNEQSSLIKLVLWYELTSRISSYPKTNIGHVYKKWITLSYKIGFMRWVKITNFFLISESTTWRMELTLLTLRQGPRKILAYIWERVSRNNFTLLVDKF